MSLKENLQHITQNIPAGVALVAVSKTKPTEQIHELYHAGQRIFGENKVQELLKKMEELPKDIDWHLIGHLQSNKIKYIVPFVGLIQSIDSAKLLQLVEKEALKQQKLIRCLLQIHIAEEETKFGFSEKEVIEMLDSDIFRELKEHSKTGKGILICGLMGMATFTENQQQIQNEFKQLKSFFDTIKYTYFENDAEFKHLSMGMSDDYLLAIEQGSTMVRVGSAIFGRRNYSAE